MSFSDIIFVFQWWLMFFIIGLIFLPVTTNIFSNFFDKGYIFSKIIGIAFISYAVFLLGILKILPFSTETIILVTIIALAINAFIFLKVTPSRRSNLIKSSWKIFIFEEIIFLAALFFWSYIRAHEPSIHGLEKYMDFGFINSILRSTYFPPIDMWFPPYPINYYYFGHLVTAILTKLSAIPSFVTYNLMLSTIFAFTFTASFSIGANLMYLKLKSQNSKVKITGQNSKVFRNLDFDSWRLFGNWKLRFGILATGLLSAFIVSLAGNLHTLYTFFKPYVNENPVPFWQLVFSPNTFPNGYWYPNATRFIENTIHEFPIYSAVVSDLHGHYLDVPIVLLTIAVLLSLISKSEARKPKQYQNSNVQNSKLRLTWPKRFGHLNFGHLDLFRISNLGFRILLLAFLLAIMYMTNAWDGIIYFGLVASIFLYLNLKNSYSPDVSSKSQKSFGDRRIKSQNYNLKLKIKNSFQIENFKLKILLWLFTLFIIAVTFILFTLPFNFNFKPFASGIGVLCAPEFLTDIGKIGPFLFEKDHCQKSPSWQLTILYGFFYFWVISFIIMILKRLGNLNFGHWDLFRNWKLEIRNLYPSDLFVLLLIAFSTLLILIPEFIYVKDIYPGHYRANTMFKLVYQAFIMLSIASAYIAVRSISNIKNQISKTQIKNKIFNPYYVYLLFAILFFILVMIYSYLAINSYYGNLKTYHGLDGIKYLKNLYPTDYEAILWINKNIKDQPVILEAQGDSYTDYARVSSNTGLPTVLGWTVHEWLWRGTYDIPSPRIEEVQKMYESEDLKETRSLLKKYKVELVFLGNLEHQKYTSLNEQKFNQLGKIIYQNGETIIYKIK